MSIIAGSSLQSRLLAVRGFRGVQLFLLRVSEQPPFQETNPLQPKGDLKGTSAGEPFDKLGDDERYEMLMLFTAHRRPRARQQSFHVFALSIISASCPSG